MAKDLLTRINIFLFLAWSHFGIFSISLVLSSYIIKFFVMPFSKFISITTYDGIRISITFAIITIFQWLYKNIISSFIRPSFDFTVTLISSQAISILMIKKLLTKTVFIKYQLSYIAIFLCFIIPFYDFLIESFKKRNKNYFQTP